jgi:hypothetical protein
MLPQSAGGWPVSRVASALLALILGAALLAGCGSTITIVLPGGPTAGTAAGTTTAGAAARPAARPAAGTAAARAPRKPAGKAAAAAPPALPAGYARLFSPAPHAFRYSLGPEPVRRGAVSERYELRDRDCGGSDCGNFRARAEIAQNRDATLARLDRDIWYGWSFFNANMGAVTDKSSLGVVLGQWKLEGDVPASFRLLQVARGENDLSRCDPRFCTRGGTAADDVMLELDEMAQAMGWKAAQNRGRICRLFSLEGNRGRWVDLVVNTNFGTGGHGYVRVWVNGELRCSYQGQVVSARAARTASPGPTARRGIFASYTERWVKAFGQRPRPTLVAFYDEFLAGSSRDNVDPGLRAAQGRPPLD